MKRCIICDSDHDKKGKTCSWKCAGILAGRSRKSTKLTSRKKAQTLYKSEGKSNDIKFLLKLIQYRASRATLDPRYDGYFTERGIRKVAFEPYEMPKKILTFEGGGIFTKTIMKLIRSKEYLDKHIEYYVSLDKSADLIKEAKEEYGMSTCDSHGRMCLSPDTHPLKRRVTFQLINKSLSDYLTNSGGQVKEKRGGFNFVWLDYCGVISKGVLLDLINVKEFLDNNFFFFITLFKGREKLTGLNKYISSGLRDNLVCYLIDLLMPSRMFYINKYKKMVTYGFCTNDIYKDLLRQGYLDNKK